jgi:hypothetical protein
MTEPSNNKLIVALHKVQGRISGVKRDSTNPHFKNRYASLEAVIDAIRPALQENDLIVTQAPGRFTESGCIEITTTISHISGQSMNTRFEVPLSKKDAQGAGSAITYGCRYSLMAMFMIPPTDDDGEGSIDRDNKAVFPRDDTKTPKSSYSLKKEQPDRWPTIIQQIRECSSRMSLKELKRELLTEVSNWPQAWRDALSEEWDKQYESLDNRI